VENDVINVPMILHEFLMVTPALIGVSTSDALCHLGKDFVSFT
jgi:hypothetical protein